jgi:hypothetical protein
MPDQEQERLKRLRERQLQDRDPLVKQRQFHHESVIKEKRSKKPFSFSKAWADMPHVAKVPIYGLLLGILVIVLLPYVWDSQWTFLTSAGMTVVFIIFGMIVGNALDLRDDIKDHLK